jgi:hypothetical protein
MLARRIAAGKYLKFPKTERDDVREPSKGVFEFNPRFHQRII